MKFLGADRVIDYTSEGVIFDTPGKSSFSRCKGSLNTRGIYLSTVPTLAVALQMLWTSKIGSKRAAFAATGLRPPDKKSQDLVLLGELIDEGVITPVIDRRYSLEQSAGAHRYVEAGKKGNVVVTVQLRFAGCETTPKRYWRGALGSIFEPLAALYRAGPLT